MTKSYILAIDQGTSSTKTIVFDLQGNVLAKATVAQQTTYLANGFVEQDPKDILQNVLLSVKECVKQFEATGASKSQIKTCGISNQRETFVLWDSSGKALHPAVVWQCKRSVEVCERLIEDGLEQQIKTKTGLIIDPYFSATKLIWLKENHPSIANDIENGKVYFGTIDTWLLYKLSNGSLYFTDHTNASRTMMFNLQTLTWDQEILELFSLKGLNLPDIGASSSDYGFTDFGGIFDEPLSIGALIGDSHAAAFGEGCLKPGMAKATLGTGCSVLMNTGGNPTSSNSGMMSTLCWSTAGRVDYALEGVIVSCGASIEWLKNELQIIKSSDEVEPLASEVDDAAGVYLIPAFSGLGAPFWDMDRRAEIVGLNFSSNKKHIIRAALDSVAFQLKAVLTAMEEDTKQPINKLMVNGGMTANNLLLQIIADVLQVQLTKGNNPDVSAWGAALLAGLSAGLYQNIQEIEDMKIGQHHITAKNNLHLANAYEGWLYHIKSKTKA
ncbi:FGGY family carbohydrate kinase [Pelobium manganitolerans]|uniref:FGGY family carbohydrate kinase n=1 Tax=Pelobium manganitolerans TaxID=1842495 RepID=UPI003FA346BF